MSVSYIPETVKIRLRGKAGGRCQYDGCNEALWIDNLTQAEFNSAYLAHIIADKPTGPRGDPTLSEQLKGQGGTTINNVYVTVNVAPATPSVTPPVAVAPSVTPEIPAAAKIVLRLNPSPYQTVKCGSCSRYVVSLASSAYCSDECRAGNPKVVGWSPEPFPATADEYNARFLRSAPILVKA